MFVNVEMCKTVLIAGESTDYEFSAAIFIELLKFFCEVLTIIFQNTCVFLATYQGHILVLHEK